MGTAMNGDEMLALLERQRDLSVRLKELSKRQRILIAEENPSGLLSLLGERGKVTEELAGVTAAVGYAGKRPADGHDTEEPLPHGRGSDQESGGRCPPYEIEDGGRCPPYRTGEQRGRAERLLAEIRRTMSEVMAADADDVKRLEVRKRGVSQALQGVQGRATMLSAYRGSQAATNTLDQTEGRP